MIGNTNGDPIFRLCLMAIATKDFVHARPDIFFVEISALLSARPCIVPPARSWCALRRSADNRRANGTSITRPENSPRPREGDDGACPSSAPVPEGAFDLRVAQQMQATWRSLLRSVAHRLARTLLHLINGSSSDSRIVAVIPNLIRGELS